MTYFSLDGREWRADFDKDRDAAAHGSPSLEPLQEPLVLHHNRAVTPHDKKESTV